MAEGNATRKAIEALIEALKAEGDTGVPIPVNPDGLVTGPMPELSGSDTAVADEQLKERIVFVDGDETPQYNVVSESNDTLETVTDSTGFKPVDVAGFYGGNLEDTTDPDTTVPDEQIQRHDQVETEADTSQSTAGSQHSPTDHHYEWYQLNPALQRAEIKAMSMIHPDAKMGYLPNGKMYWAMRLRPVICGSRKDWTLLAVYDSDHPQKRRSGSVKFYPVKPNYQEMVEMVNESSVSPKTIPHLLRDSDKQVYFCTIPREEVKDGQHKGEQVTTAATLLRHAMVWITAFELGLIDQETWSAFQGSKIKV